VSGRAYLSIGDVLTLLREEFPDVTISKIRFLESQGLVNPERSPSGYRKFFEPDVERLRWVLRQQREHFLPLKVIRDRLAAGDLSDLGPEAAVEPTTSTVRRNGKVPQPAHAAVGAGIGARSGGARTGPADSPDAGADYGPSRTEEQSAKADQEAMARILADASRRAARIPENGNGAAAERTALSVVPDLVEPAPNKAQDHAESASTPDPPPGRAAAQERTAAAEPPRSTARSAPAIPSAAPKSGADDGGPAAVTAARPATSGAAAKSAPAPVATTAPAKAAEKAAAAPVAPAPTAALTPTPTPTAPPAPAAAAPAAPTPKPSTTTTSMVTGVSLTAEELCAASGLSESELTGLQGFGLIESVMVAGIPTFNEDALTVANLASAFRKFGIEPRHLRLYRNAVDREMGLIEQVVIPLLRQRNPESRQRAIDGAEELGALGQTMRATLLRSALRRHLGG
jgi:DNA-binding transcriptional MerR regulator